MKKLYFLMFLFCMIKTSSAQVLLEDIDGDKIVNNNAVLTPAISRLSLIKLNTGDQSLGFSYFYSTALHDPAKYAIHEFGLKAAPTAGYAAVIKNGQFSPGIRLNYGFTIVNLFNRPTTSKIIDWGNIDLGFNYDKYLLYQQNAVFNEQLYYQISKTYHALISYNMLINSKFILNLKAGYNRRNNFNDLNQLTINDITSLQNGNTNRQIESSSVAGVGDYKEYNSFPQIIAITRATKTDDAGSSDAEKLRLGYTVFFKNQFSSYLSRADAGAILFLTKQAKSGVRNPVLGIVMQAVDLFDELHVNNDFQKRIRLGFTTSFSL